MDKLLDVVAQSLRVRRTIDRTQNCPEGLMAFKYEYEKVPESVAEQFKVELINHLNEILSYKEKVVYSFESVKGFLELNRELYYNGIRKKNVNSLNPVQNRLFRDADNNLIAVFNRLPPLGEGEEYAFPRDTFITFTVSERLQKLKKVKVSASPWIMHQI